MSTFLFSPLSFSSRVSVSDRLILFSREALSAACSHGEVYSAQDPLRLPHQYGKLTAGLTHFPIIVCRCSSEQAIPGSFPLQESTLLAERSCWELQKEKQNKGRIDDIPWWGLPGTHTHHLCRGIRTGSIVRLHILTLWFPVGGHWGITLPERDRAQSTSAFSPQ